jgi:hypothetical protein
MQTDDLYKYVGLFIIVIFLIYIVVKTLKFQFKVLEGLTANSSSQTAAVTTAIEKMADAVKSNATTIEDALLLNKYTKNYEDILMELDTYLDIYILQSVLVSAEPISKGASTPANQTIMSNIINAKNYKDCLNLAMKTLDKK